MNAGLLGWTFGISHIYKRISNLGIWFRNMIWLCSSFSPPFSLLRSQVGENLKFAAAGRHFSGVLVIINSDNFKPRVLCVFFVQQHCWSPRELTNIVVSALGGRVTTKNEPFVTHAIVEDFEHEEAQQIYELFKSYGNKMQSGRRSMLTDLRARMFKGVYSSEEVSNVLGGMGGGGIKRFIVSKFVVQSDAIATMV